VSVIGRLLDKKSRLTKNPKIGDLPRRLWQSSLNALHSIGLYRLPGEPVYRRFDEDLTVCLLPGEFLTKRVWFHGYVQYDEEYFLREYVSPGMVIIDAGANIGTRSLICGKRVRPGGMVHAFEPMRQTYALLRRNVARNELGDVIRVNRMAVLDRTGQMVRFIQEPRHSDMARVDVRDGSVLQGEDGLMSDEVQSVALDGYVESNDIQRLDLVKLDIEGSESKAFSGCRRMLLRFRPTVICEFNGPLLRRMGSCPRDLWEAFKGLGYGFYTYNARARFFTLKGVCCSEESVETYIGTVDIEHLAKRIGASIHGRD